MRLEIVAGGQPPAEHLTALTAVFTSVEDSRDDIAERSTSPGTLTAQPLSAWRHAGIYETAGLTPHHVPN